MHRFLPVLLLFIVCLPLSGQAFSFPGDEKKLSLDSETVNRRDYMGRTLLMKAARRGDIDTVNAALELGADPGIRDNNGQTALFYAIQFSNSDMIDLLLYTTSLDNPFDRKGRSLLDLYIARGKTYGSALFYYLNLLEDGTEVKNNLLYNDGESVLFKLFQREESFRNAVLRDLVFLGCSLDEVNSAGRTPYEEAQVREGFEETALLLQDIRDELSWQLINEIYSNPSMPLSRADYYLSRGASADYISSTGLTACDYAVIAGRPDLLQYLLDWNPGADPLAVSRDLGLIPFFALNKEEATAVSLLDILFENGISPDSRDEEGETLLNRAITRSLPLASRILASGADPNMVSPGGVTPMMKVLTMNMQGDFSLIHELTAAGADLKAKDDAGQSILIYAIIYGQSSEVLTALLDAGISMDERDDYGTPAFFFLSAFHNSPDILLPLLKEEERYFWRDKDGWTALHGALNFRNSPEMVEALSPLYPDGTFRDGTLRNLDEFRQVYEERVGVQDLPELDHLIRSRRIYPAGEIPLFYDPDEELRILLEKGSEPGLVSAFVREGADLSLHYPDGFSPLLTAAALNSAEMVQALLNEGATVFDSTPYGWTPLHVASWQSDPGTASLLLKEGLNVNVRDFDYWTALHWAARNNASREFIEVLIDAGADPALVNYKSETPLHLACQGWVEPSADTIELLLNAGADINALNFEGTTPLMHAAGQGYINVCRLLIEAGADADLADSSGMTASMHAAARSHNELADYLRSREN